MTEDVSQFGQQYIFSTTFSTLHPYQPMCECSVVSLPALGLLGSWGAVCSLGSQAPLGKEPRVARVGGYCRGCATRRPLTQQHRGRRRGRTLSR